MALCNILSMYIKRDTFPALLVNFVACTRAWIMFDGMNQTEEGVGLKDKRIEFDEFRGGLLKLSHTITEDIVLQEWSAVDSDGKGMVLFNEFANWYQTKLSIPRIFVTHNSGTRRNTSADGSISCGWNAQRKTPKSHAPMRCRSDRQTFPPRVFVPLYYAYRDFCNTLHCRHRRLEQADC